MVRRYEMANGKIVESQNDQSPILVYINPSEAEKKHLTEEWKLDEHTLNSALDPDELSRLEFEPEHVALIFKRPKNYSAGDNFLFKVSSLGLFLFKDRLVVVLAEDIPLFEGKPYRARPVAAQGDAVAALPLDLPLPRAPEGHQHDLRLPGAEDQHLHGEQVPAQPVHPGKEPGLLPQRHQLQRHGHRQAQEQRRQDRLRPATPRSSSTTSSSRTTSASSRPRSTPTSCPA